MIKYWFLLLFPCLAMGQLRENNPLPVLAEEPTGILEEAITGWCYSLDGQWVSEENTIPVRAVSRDKQTYKSDENALGLDNLQAIKTYPVQYGKDTLFLIVKFFKEGSFKYPATKSGWKTQLNAYYYLVPISFLKDLNALYNQEEKKLMVEMIHGGLVSNIKERNALEEIEKQLIVKDSYDRNMVLHIKPFLEQKVVQFQLYSLHEIFSDVEGVLHNFTLNGKSVYGSPVLLNYIYYETPLDNFKAAFSLNTAVEYRTN